MFCDIIPNLNKNVSVTWCPGKDNIVYHHRNVVMDG